MSEEIVSKLLSKRAAMAAEIVQLQAGVFHIDETLKLLGHTGGRMQQRIFAHGELMALIGDAERSGLSTNAGIADYVIKAKDLPSGQDMRRRIQWSVKDCRKRMNARGA